MIDNSLSFKSHSKNIYYIVNQKIYSNISKLAAALETRSLENSFIKSEFSYGYIVWIFSSKGFK